MRGAGGEMNRIAFSKKINVFTDYLTSKFKGFPLRMNKTSHG